MKLVLLLAPTQMPHRTAMPATTLSTRGTRAGFTQMAEVRRRAHQPETPGTHLVELVRPTTISPPAA